MDPSAELVKTVCFSNGCHAPPVQGEQCPFVFLRSRMYMSPLSNSPSSRPSLSKIFGCGCPVTHRNWSPLGDHDSACTGYPSIGTISRKGLRSRFMPLKSYILTP